MNNNEKKELLQLIEESHNTANIEEIILKIKKFIDINNIVINDLEELKREYLIFSHLSNNNVKTFDIFTHIWFSVLTIYGKNFINYQNEEKNN